MIVVRSILLSLVGVLSLVLPLSCIHNPVDSSPKNPRNYKWTVDTLVSLGGSYSVLESIWGASRDNVFATGIDEANSLYRFDGKGWAPSTVPGGGVFYQIYGFSSSDLFAVGGMARNNPAPPPSTLFSSLMAHFNGNWWSRQLLSSDGAELRTVWGAAPNDVWAAGATGSLWHYNGVSWNRTTMETSLDFKRMTGTSPNDIYLLGTRINDPQNYYLNYYVLAHYDGSNWRIVDSSSIAASQFGSRFGDMSLGTIGGVIYSVGFGIFSLRNNAWQLEKASQNAILDLYASSPSNAFAVGFGPSVLHFDGQTWQEVVVVETNCWPRAVWCTEREAFIVATTEDGRRTIIIHGE